MVREESSGDVVAVLKYLKHAWLFHQLDAGELVLISHPEVVISVATAKITSAISQIQNNVWKQITCLGLSGIVKVTVLIPF